MQRQTANEFRPNGVAAAEFLNPKDGNLVAEGLKAWLARERRKASDAAAENGAPAR